MTKNQKYACIDSIINYKITKASCAKNPANNMVYHVYRNPHAAARLQMNYWDNIAIMLVAVKGSYSNFVADKFYKQHRQRQDKLPKIVLKPDGRGDNMKITNQALQPPFPLPASSNPIASPLQKGCSTEYHIGKKGRQK